MLVFVADVLLRQSDDFVDLRLSSDWPSASHVQVRVS